MKTITLDEIDRYIADNDQDESAFLKPALAFADAVIAHFHDRQEVTLNRMPWEKCRDKFNIRPAEVTQWMGYNGHGKSLILGQVANHLMAIGEGVCIASLEMRPHVTMARMCRQAIGASLPTIDAIRRYHEWTDGRLWIYDQNGSTPAYRIHNLVRYCASIGIKHVIVDSLMKVVSRDDDYNGQKEFTDGLCVLARDTGVHIHIVHHSRKGQDETKIPGKMDGKGSGAVSDLVDNCVTVFRVKQKKDATEHDCLLVVDKQRHGEWEGIFGLYFDAASQGFAEDTFNGIKRINIPGLSISKATF